MKVIGLFTFINVLTVVWFIARCVVIYDRKNIDKKDVTLTTLLTIFSTNYIYCSDHLF